MTVFDSISPADLGLPPRFDKFRLPQREALAWLQDSDAPLSAACLPTGTGKTALAVGWAKLLGGKAVYAVATKALEKQVLDDFGSCGMVNIHGRANYTCPNYKDCDHGFDNDCSLSNTDACPYTIAAERARASDLVVTNYAYWLWSHGRKNRAFEGTDLLICDEAHAIEGQLSGFASVKIYRSEYGTLPSNFTIKSTGAMQPNGGGAYGGEADDSRWWKSWAIETLDRLGGPVEDKDDDLYERVYKIARMGPNWVWQFDGQGHVIFEPVRLSGFTRGLFSSVPQILMMSASLNEFTLRLLLPDDLPVSYRVWGQVFPPQNAPVYHIPTRKLNWKSTDEDYQAIIKTADDIIDNRRDRKGIIHTVSYARTQRALQYSRYRNLFVWNENSTTLPDRLEQFRRAKPPKILVTPSVPAGFDFPGDQAEYQIILKFPFPNETQRVIKERCSQIPGYRLWSAAQEAVQMCGRARRYHDDRCETFILDNAAVQLTGKEGRSYCPPGFRIFTVTQVPPAPPKINS